MVLNRMEEPASKKSKRFLNMAAGVATQSLCRMKHGAVVVKHSKVLGASPNIEKNNPRYVGWQYASVHAEERALRRAGFPKNATVYVARVNNFGQIRLSKPCDACQELIDSLQCKVVWTE